MDPTNRLSTSDAADPGLGLDTTTSFQPDTDTSTDALSDYRTGSANSNSIKTASESSTNELDETALTGEGALSWSKLLDDSATTDDWNLKGTADGLDQHGFPSFDIDARTGEISFGNFEDLTRTQPTISDYPHLLDLSTDSLYGMNTATEHIASTLSGRTAGGFGAEPSAANSVTQRSGEEPSLQDMVKWYQDNFDKLDGDRDGIITERELQHAVLNPDLASGDGAIYLASIENLEDISRVFASDTGKIAPPRAVGLTRDNLGSMQQAVENQSSDETQERLGIGKIRDYIQHVDENQDGCITREELDAALKSDKFNETQRTQLERLKERFSEIEKVNQSNIGESRSENSPQPVYLPMGNEEEFVSVADLQDAATRESEVLEEIQNSLNQTVDHLKSPFRVDQQGTDSCFALAWLEGMDPGAVERMIHDNEDGSVTVTFPGDPEHPVTIQKPNEGEKAQFTLGNAGLIEKALGQYLSELSPEEREKYQTEPREGQKPILVQHELSPGGEPAAVMELLTGRDAKSTQLLPGMSEDSIHEALTQATKIDQIITAGTQDLLPGDIGMQPRHAYHVTYNPETRMVTLTNPSKPVGSYVGEPTKPDGTAADGNADGSFEIPLSEFKARMIGIYTGARL